MSYVLFNPEPEERKGLPAAFYVSNAFGRSSSPGYLGYARWPDQAKKWKTAAGAERYLDRWPVLRKKGYRVLWMEDL